MCSFNVATFLKREVKQRLEMAYGLQTVYSKSEKWLYSHEILSTENLYLPDFLGIGAPQSGTTWLYENLRQHPEIYFDEKEMRFFEAELFPKSLKFHYSDKFKPGSRKVKGDISPGYSIIPIKQQRFIRTIMPGVRIIFLMRNPIDRTWTATRRVFSKALFYWEGSRFQSDFDRGKLPEYLRIKLKRKGFKLSRQVTVSVLEKGGTWIITDAKKNQTYTVIKEAGNLVFYYSTLATRKLFRDGKFEEIDDSDIFGYFTSGHTRKLGDYQTILDNWLSVFPTEQLYIGFFEDITNRSQELLNEIFAHIGVSQDVDWDCFPCNQVINRVRGIPMPLRYIDFLNEMYCQDINTLYKRFGTPIMGWRC